ncbi:MAG: hypothetical protein JST47_13345 [Bacteroidetes bacterium]|nr:hypothetical protein [Bacteroidota bacterium]
MSKIYSDYTLLESNHPNYTDIKNKGIGGDVGKFLKTPQETCCIQLSYALNNSFLTIGSDYEYHDVRLATGKVRAIKDDNGYNYIYSTFDMKVYLDNKYFPCENYRGSSRADLVKNINGRKGVIGFGGRHIDLWNGRQYQWENLYYNLWSTDEHHAGDMTALHGIYFWEINSFLDFLSSEYGDGSN